MVVCTLWSNYEYDSNRLPMLTNNSAQMNSHTILYKRLFLFRLNIVTQACLKIILQYLFKLNNI